MSFELNTQNDRTYEVIEKRELKDLQAEGILLRHKKTGARIALIPCEDVNKVFFIGFRTPPADSAGEAHIIEHTVLCGSEHFPVKDPFIELAKGSMNTFLNAMTFPDKTVYPVASTNDKDFRNLMHVYLDAVFHPLIGKNKSIFQQEGWHYELQETEEGQSLEINGVVYNEMKGVMSSPEDVFARKIYETLLPDTPYALESGGDPEVIPELSYEKYLEFYKAYYHPSNSYIFLYGDTDMNERLTFLEENYLKEYAYREVPSQLPVQNGIPEGRTSRISYSVMPEEDTAEKNFFSLNFAMQPIEDPVELAGLRVMDYVLFDAEGAPVPKLLYERGVAKEVYSLLECSTRQPCYTMGAKYADEAKEELFYDSLQEIFEKICREGFRKKSLEAALSSMEFRYREADYGSYPKGLIVGLAALDTWLYDDADPWSGLELGPVFESLRKKIREGGFFEKLLKKYVLDNRHVCRVIMSPEPGLEEKKSAALKKQLSDRLLLMTQEEKDQIRRESELLKAFQEKEESEEDLRKIPLLDRSDLKREARHWINREDKAGDTPVLLHPMSTGGIVYTHLLFEINDLTAEEISFINLLKILLGAVSTAKQDYLELNEEINIHTGGVHAYAVGYTREGTVDDNRLFFIVQTKAVLTELEKALDLCREIMLESRYDEADRIREILDEELSGMRADLPASGHVTAYTRALSHLTEGAALIEHLSGIEAYRFLKKLLEEPDRLKHMLDELPGFVRKLFASGRLLMDCTCEEDQADRVLECYTAFAKTLPAGQPGRPLTHRYEPSVRNEGFKTAGQIQFVCSAGNYLQMGLPYNGALRVLKVILGYNYLWTKVRMKGGAYGCMSSFSRTGDCFLVSYRDPCLTETLEVYREAADFVRNFDADDREMTKYVIGAVSSLDQPESPVVRGRASLAAYIKGSSYEAEQKYRNETLDADPSAIRSLAIYLDKLIEQNCVCVVGTREKLEQNAGIFDTAEDLL